MKIYFCGVGGVGLGPLAEIALDAGYSVEGSDKNTSLMTRRLQERGVRVGQDQSGAHLQMVHGSHPVDWFVYTSALPPDHPELLMAQILGIKMTKRDELLSHFIKEKDLKLIAVAGTHGKTTTTSLLVWTLKQLGVPVSYSIGTTLSFGPSGQYVAGSKYFVYECDEYDRNFLHFHPYLAIITSLSYDHPDTYKTPEEYADAFRDFLRHSQGSIMWQTDGDVLGEIPDSWMLGNQDVAGVTLHGEHNRRNASLVLKALERLKIPGDAVATINGFPGVDRRFEKLADNLYTDYAVHPVEISATLELARELNNDVVLVYQPHQNVRQHEVRALYTNCFERASEIYWLPTYLTRENAALEVLTPEQLAQTVTNRDAVHFAELNDELWWHIQHAHGRGALVLCMGAGTIDAWVREKLAS